MSDRFDDSEGDLSCFTRVDISGTTVSTKLSLSINTVKRHVTTVASVPLNLDRKFVSNYQAI